MDANLSEVTLTYTIRLLEERNPDCQIIYEPVSVQKSIKALRAEMLGKISVIKPNVDELVTMCNYMRSLNKEREVHKPQSK